MTPEKSNGAGQESAPFQHSERFKQQWEELILNAATRRISLFDELADPRRNIDKECGYPNDPIPAEEYQKFYERDAIAARVVEVWPRECWKSQPVVYESEDTAVTTPFEQALDNLATTLRGEKSWYKPNDATHPLWEYCERADIQSGIGSYGIMLFGINDGKRLDEPACPPEPGDPPRKLLFIRVFPEKLAQVVTWETDRKSPRYGKPTSYLVTFYDPSLDSTGSQGMQITAQNVHWTRVVHFADGLTSNEVIGNPRCRSVMNNLLNLQKVYGSGAEGFWQSCFSALTFSTHPQLGSDVKVDVEKMRDTVENFKDGLQRFLLGRGGQWSTLSPTVADPTGQINVQLEAICIRITIPMRIFKGSERGNQASDQDDDNWNRRVNGRRTLYVTPKIIVPAIDRLIWLGCLPPPETGYCVEWPDLDTQTKDQKATVAVKRTQALAQYSSSNSEDNVTPMDFFTLFLGFTEDEATSMIDNVTKALAGHDGDEETAHKQVQAGLAPFIELFKQRQAGAINDDQLRESLSLAFGLSDEELKTLVPPEGTNPPPLKPATSPSDGAMGG